ncbi:diacylglycerol kinase [Actinoplanes bogorensis]|uniref:Diacylglycerol kinase n=1 Tax=Paractinoplanes bogorensis TaxID=1610840 RepID=A0ABS5YKW1_9ACTN|nr:diacylglycerol kinase family protein [Actinoplanes bogorensis]MBU2664107.1 diacylglycerol kinase [Actinoplanes bogorensis]
MTSSRRAAAVVALASPLLALAAAFETAIRHFGNFALFVLAAAVALAAVWYALTRRGPLRWIAAVVALAAASMVILLGVSLFLVQVGMLVVFAVSGGFALGGQRHLVAVAAEPARRAVLLINPKSGDGAAERAGLAAAAAGRGIETITLKPGDDLTELAEQAVRDGADVLGMAGGDGSQALVATVAMRHEVAYVCVPAGTRNHFALDLGLDRADVVGALDAFTDGAERRIDLGQVNDRVFVNNASLGVYAEVVQSAGYRKAKIRTWGRLLPDLLGPAASPPDFGFDGPDGKPLTGATLVLVSNNPYDLSHGRRPRLDGGELGIVAARGPLPAGEWTASGFEVRSSGDVPVGLDGEALVLTPPLRFVSLPAALRVRVPRNLTPPKAGAVPTRRDFDALIRVASGVPAVP